MRKKEERMGISQSELKRTKEMLKYSVQNEVEGDRDEKGKEGKGDDKSIQN
jgi:hypothetical protein